MAVVKEGSVKIDAFPHGPMSNLDIASRTCTLFSKVIWKCRLQSRWLVSASTLVQWDK